MIKIKLEFLSWLTETLVGDSALGSLRVEQRVEEGQTVRDLLIDLAARHPRFEQSVFDTRIQKLSGEVLILYNGGLLELADGLETRLSDGDTLVFLPVIQGG